MEESNASVLMDLNCYQVKLSALVWHLANYNNLLLCLGNNLAIILIHTDVNECQRNPCGQLCINTEGSFKCSCMSGFELQTDGKTCGGKNCNVIWMQS